jgi:hypothetical protein
VKTGAVALEESLAAARIEGVTSNTAATFRSIICLGGCESKAVRVGIETKISASADLVLVLEP